MLDNSLVLLNLRLESLGIDQALSCQDLDTHEAQLDYVNSNIINYMQKELKGPKLQDAETLDFLKLLLDRTTNLYTQISARRQELDQSPYYANNLVIQSGDKANNLELFAILDGRALMPKQIFLEFVRVWVLEKCSDQDFISKLTELRKTYNIPPQDFELLALPYPRQFIIMCVLFSRKLFKSVELRQVNFICEWVSRKLVQLNSSRELTQSQFEELTSKI